MTTKDDPLFREVCAIVERFRPPDVELRPTTELSGELNVDSVTAMDLIMEIEDHFAIDIPMNLVADLRNLQDLVEVVRQQTGRR